MTTAVTAARAPEISATQGRDRLLRAVPCQPHRRQLRRQDRASSELLLHGAGRGSGCHGRQPGHWLHDRRRLAERDEPRLTQQLRLHGEVPEEPERPGQLALHLPQDGRGEHGREPGRRLPAGGAVQLDHQEQCHEFDSPRPARPRRRRSATRASRARTTSPP